jgi:predicted MPP superfamily phosphohydrolase
MAFIFTIFSIVAIFFDVYFYFGVKSVFSSGRYSSFFKTGYWGLSAIYYAFLLFTIVNFIFQFDGGKLGKLIGQMLFFGLFIPKILASSILIIDDVIRLVKWIYGFFGDASKVLVVNEDKGLSRLRFLQMSALGTFGVVLSSMTYGILKGAYNYTVHKHKIKIPNLPDEFVGMKFAQISDLHVGSFLSIDPMKEAVGIINNLDIEMVFFTGDLVNDRAEEAVEYIDVFKEIKHKVYSVMGNHDYPEYVYSKDDHVARKHNFDLMMDVQKKMDFDLLMNENRIIERNGKKLAIVGIENWGGSFSKYGDMKKAMKGTEDADVKLLLSHDPSHWDLEVKKSYKDIDVMFAGHTHGMQFGIEAFGIKFSPVQWKYKQWAGLYKENNQQLYVNRGLGFIGYPGRVGISPEISVFELTK